MKKVTILALAIGCAYGASAQYVTSIWSDFDGFWTSSNASVSPVEPDSSHHLLAFEWGGTVFSTGVNDSILDANAVAYTQGRFRGIDYGTSLTPGQAFQTGSNNDGNTSTVTTGATIQITVDGTTSPLVYSATVATQRDQARRLLRDGIRGLDLGTGMVNMPIQTLDLPLPASGVASGWNDGVPEFIFTQAAGSSGSLQDSVILLDGSGNPMGNWVKLDFRYQTTNLVGNWRVDVRTMNTGALVGANNNTQRAVQVIGLDFDDFGITAAQVPDVAEIRHQFTGISDMVFLSYNERSFVDCAAAAVTLSSVAPIAATSPAALDGEMVPSISGGTSPVSLREVGTTTWIPSADWDTFRAGVYMMEAVDDLGCASSTAVRVMLPNMSCNTPG